MPRESRLELSIERPVAGGRMLARHDGRIVLVSGAIPGERVVARVERVSKRVAFASTVDVIEPSEHRRPVTSDPACGGLLLAHVAYEHQLRLKAAILADTFRRIGKLSLPALPVVTPSPEEGYRMRARLHVRNGRAGFFREGTRTICDAGPSRQLSAGALPAVERVIASVGEQAPAVDAITLAENADATTRVVLIEVAPGATFHAPPIALQALEDVAGVCLAQGGRSITLGGQAAVYDAATAFGTGDVVLPRVGWTRSVASFFQGNRFVLGPLLRAVLAKAAGERVVDLYAGVGLFAVPLAARGAEVVAIEGDAASGADLETNAAAWPGLDARLTSVEDALLDASLADVDCVVLDPPRTGVSPQALDRLRRLRAPRLVYVSCDPATLARDAAALAAGGYDLNSIEAFDMFPNTSHIEALAVFDRR